MPMGPAGIARTTQPSTEADGNSLRRAACHFSDLEKVHAYAEEHPEQAYKGINEAVRFDQRGSEISTTSRSAGWWTPRNSI